MKKEILFRLIVLFLFITLTLMAVLPINKEYDPVEWMKKLSDDTLISEMAIPGTHDSGATHSIFDISGKCQDITIDTQLNIGVRFFDIRLKLKNDEFVIVHSFVDQDLKLIDVLDSFNEFITYHDEEFLIISFKEEASAVNSSLDFDTALIDLLKKYDKFTFENSLPKKLGEARGNIYMLNRFNDSELGLPAYSGWMDSTSFDLPNLYVQDNYSIDDIEDKKKSITDAFEYAKSSDKVTLNYTSCYLNILFPPTYAGTSANTINNWLPSYIDNFEINGVVIVDFATEELVKTIYMENKYENSK